jgi:hypothetical protein
MGFGLCSLLLTNRAKRTIDVRMNIIFLEDFFGGNNANVRHFLSRLEKLIEFVNKYGVFWTTQKKKKFWDSFLFLYTAILFFVALDRTHISSETLHKYTEHLYILTKNKIVISFEIPKYHFQFIFSKSEDKCVYRCKCVTTSNPL